MEDPGDMDRKKKKDFSRRKKNSAGIGGFLYIF